MGRNNVAPHGRACHVRYARGRVCHAHYACGRRVVHSTPMTRCVARVPCRAVGRVARAVLAAGLPSWLGHDLVNQVVTRQFMNQKMHFFS